MTKSFQALSRLSLVLSLSIGAAAPAFARSAEMDAQSMSASREEMRIARTERVTGELKIVNGALELTEKASGHTYRIEDNDGAVLKLYNAGTHVVSIEGTTRGNGTIVTETVDGL